MSTVIKFAPKFTYSIIDLHVSHFMYLWRFDRKSLSVCDSLKINLTADFFLWTCGSDFQRSALSVTGDQAETAEIVDETTKSKKKRKKKKEEGR